MQNQIEDGGESSAGGYNDDRESVVNPPIEQTA